MWIFTMVGSRGWSSKPGGRCLVGAQTGETWEVETMSLPIFDACSVLKTACATIILLSVCEWACVWARTCMRQTEMMCVRACVYAREFVRVYL